MMYELPPMAQGTPEQQLVALRDYLVRLAQELDRVSDGKDITVIAEGAAQKAREQSVKDVQAQAATLKALIIKTADEIVQYADSKVELYNSLYVAQSDYGNYYQAIETQVEQTASGVVENYHYSDAIQAAQDTATGAVEYMTELNGQIRRGVIRDIETDEVQLGIAISEKLSFTGNKQTQGGLTYYELTSGQTLGLYTATGWQFWIGGVKRGWFSSQDSMLHVANIVVEDKLQFGAEWEITTTGGFGIRYIGG